MRKFCLFFFAVIAFVLLISCSENQDFFVPNPDFSLNLNVTDSSGNPVPNLEIYVCNDIRSETGYYGRPCCCIGFTVSRKSKINCSVYDLNNRLVKTFIDSVLNMGDYNCFYSESTYPNGEPIKGNSVILRYQVTARDTLTNEIIYNDSGFMLRYIEFYYNCGNYSIGSLDSQGHFSTNNATYFPSLYNITMDRIDPESWYLGEFKVLDSFQLILWDSATNEYQLYSETIQPGDNYFELNWDNHLPIETEHKKDRDVFFDMFWLVEENVGVNVNWSTLAEEWNYGWNIYRSTTSNFESAIQINPYLIGGACNSTEQYFYDYQDNDVEDETEYYYWVESIDFFENSLLFGPESIFFNGQEDMPPLPWHIYQYPNPFN